MRTVTTITNYYTFDELSKEAQEKALENYIRDTYDVRAEALYDCMEADLDDMFPNSALKPQFQLCYCQGDGVNIYGKMNGSDLLEYIKNDLTEDQYNGLLELLNTTTFELKENKHSYGYFRQHYLDFYRELVDNDFNHTNKVFILDFSELACEKLERLCDKWKKEGYEYIYEPDKEDIADEICGFEYEFLEDGTRA